MKNVGKLFILTLFHIVLENKADFFFSSYLLSSSVEAAGLSVLWVV